MLKEFLENKPLYYTEIDYTRMPRVYEKVKKSFNLPKIIHLIGTNGKGTTGRFLASALNSLGFSVGHYTSPHILKFNERIWLNGDSVDDSTLDKNHIKLQKLLSKKDLDSLSYFEYTTLLAMMVYDGCDYVILEAGLGGEYDATAVFKKELTLVTPIDFDHEAFLGETIEEIATTKLNAIQKRAILADQKFDKVYEIALNKDAKIERVGSYITPNDIKNIEMISKALKLPKYLQENLKLSISALNLLGIKYDVDDFKDARLFGRLSRLDENIYIDVGHNTLASKAILESLLGEKYILVYNTYKDKNYEEILEILKPIIKSVEIIDVDEDRIESKEKLEKTLDKLAIKHSCFNGIDKDENYLVFGSFSVVERFLKGYYE